MTDPKRKSGGYQRFDRKKAAPEPATTKPQTDPAPDQAPQSMPVATSGKPERWGVRTESIEPRPGEPKSMEWIIAAYGITGAIPPRHLPQDLTVSDEDWKRVVRSFQVRPNLSDVAHAQVLNLPVESVRKVWAEIRE